MLKSVEIVKLLQNMPKAVENIAFLLYKDEIRGIRANPHECPINKYIEKHTNTRCLSSLSAIVIYDERNTRIPVPPQVMAFMVMFDSGHFPELILLEAGHSAPLLANV